MQFRPGRCITAALIGLGLAACLDHDGLGSAEDSSWEAFERDARRTLDGRTVYVVEGDQPVTVDELRAYHEAHAGARVGTSSQASTVNRVFDRDDVWRPEEAQDLSYCISDAFGADKPRVITEMAQATAAWEAVANVRFRYVASEDGRCFEPAARVVFPVRPWDDRGARAFFPSSASDREIVINLGYFETDSWREAAPNVTTLGVFRHELGHALGLRHEHVRAAPPCVEGFELRYLTIYDQASVMHYPHCNGVHTSDQSITALDAAGVRLLYGGRNLALDRTATQSSTSGVGAASRAVDGNVDGAWDHRSVSSTNAEPGAWWQVDLGAVRDIGDVVLYNRTDCCPERLTRFRVQLSNDAATWRTAATVVGTAGRRTPLSVQAAGRHVRVQLIGTGHLSLAEVQVLPRVNVAVDFRASQSSDTAGGEAIRAIDGTVVGPPTRTSQDTNPWWELDFGGQDMVRVGDIVLHSRAAGELADLDILVARGIDQWDVVDTLRGPQPARVMVSVQRSTRTIRIQRRGPGVLSLAEVEVFRARNLASGRTAVQSSTRPDGDAANAVDGTDARGLESTATTTPETAPWWQLDLGEVVSLDEAVVHRGFELYSTGELDVRVWFDEEWRLAAQVDSLSDHLRLGLGRVGRALRVGRTTDSEYEMALAEVEVYATPNLALGKTASQSSTSGIGSADHAVDGNADGDWGHGSVTATNLEAQPWWQVDLGRPSAVERVVLFNRTDCCTERLSNLRIETSTDGSTWTIAATLPQTLGPRTEIPVSASARYLRVRLAGTGHLSLAEVQVLGTPGASVWDVPR
jgi:hypothetical protein